MEHQINRVLDKLDAIDERLAKQGESLARLILLLMILFAGPALARPQTSYFAFEGTRIPFNRDFLFPNQEHWDYQVRLLWDVSWGRFWMGNDVTGRTYGSRFRYVSWEFTTGINLLPGLDIVHYHKSQHAIDWKRDKFPVIDGYGVRITFAERK